MARVVVVGGGIGGLATALFSARRGHDVVVVERDEPPPGDAPDELATWRRRGVAQAPFAHYFIARSNRILREEAPDLIPEFVEAGITVAHRPFGEGYEHDHGLAARRLVYEGLLRRFVLRRGIEWVQDSVRGLVADPSEDRRIRGVRLGSGGELHADLTVDAGGRRSASTRWLRDLGLDEPAVEEEPVGLHYHSRHYRLREDATYPTDAANLVEVLPFCTVLIFRGDNRTFSVAIALSARDPLKRHLQDPAVFDRVLAAVPLTASWLDRSDPIGELHVMAGLSNRRRRLVVGGGPVATGFAFVGDSSLYTNPTLGQGVSLSLWMAQRLADAVERVDGDPAGTGTAYEAWVEEELVPRFRWQIQADRASRRQLDAGIGGAGLLPPEDDHGRYVQAAMILAAEEEDVLQQVMRVNNLLEPPRTLWDAPAVARKVRAHLATDPDLGGGEGPLPRSAFEGLVSPSR